MQTAVLDVVADHLPAAGAVLAPGWAARQLPVAGGRLRADDLDAAAPGAYAAAALLDDEVSDAGEHAEGLIDALGAALEPGGVLALSLRNRVHADVVGDVLGDVRGYSADEARALVEHRGFAVELLCAPGAAARLRGDVAFSLEADRRPGLLDAAPTLLLVARAPLDEQHRTEVFLASRPRKIAAAATLCRDGDGRLLVVYDRYKRSWTIPGGVIDADEDPTVAAHRETWEEAGVKSEIGRILGVFSVRWPDRLVFVFEARPLDPAPDPTPVHGHEIGAAEWVPLDEAIDRVAPRVAFKIRRCLERPGHTWVQ